MINKTTVFASGSENIDPTGAGYTEGMIPQTVARAEQVNKYMQMGDQDLYVVCQEIKNLLAQYGISPNNGYQPEDFYQLANMFATGVKNCFSLTGLDKSSYTTAPTQSGNAIAFPEMKIVFNTDVYYGQTDSTHKKRTLSATTLSANSSWTQGVYWIYARKTSDTVCVLDKQTTPIAPEDAATKCMLGTVYVYNNAFQTGTWKFQPWLQITTPERRESPTAMIKGGEIRPNAATTLRIGQLEVLDEGMGFDTSAYTPNIKNLIASQQAFTYKFLYPGYNVGDATKTVLDSTETTRYYNTTTGSFTTFPASFVSDTNPKYVVMVPCITPAGQTLLIAPQSSNSYEQVYDSIDAAIAAVWNQTYSLNGANGQSVAARCIFLNQSFIVKIGATNLQDPTQFVVVGEVPHQLGSFNSGVGQTGGSIADYRPMPAITWNGTGAVTCRNNAINIIPNTGTTNRNVTLPTPQAGIVNQLEVHFTKTNTGIINFTNTINWWLGVTPVFSLNQTYVVILEYVNGAWYGGYLSVVV